MLTKTFRVFALPIFWCLRGTRWRLFQDLSDIIRYANLHCNTIYIVCPWLATGRWFSSGTPVSFTNKTARHYITEKLLKVVLRLVFGIIVGKQPVWACGDTTSFRLSTLDGGQQPKHQLVISLYSNFITCRVYQYIYIFFSTLF